MNAVGYSRVSGAGQLDGDGMARQQDAILSFAKSKNFTVSRIYEERAVPGKNEMDDRPAFKEMVADLLFNGCRQIIVEELGRLAREYRIQEQLLIYLVSKKIDLWSSNTGECVTEAIMGDPMRKAMVQIQSVFAELDKNMLVAKLSKARARMRQNGRCEGRKIYGDKAYPGEADLVKRILDASQRGLNVPRIVESLNELGMKTRYGKPWNPVQVSRILKREKL